MGKTWGHLNRFGLTKDQYLQMLKSQKGLCAICNKPPSPKKALAVDHIWGTKKVRGLLCISCNVIVGKQFEKLEILEAAIKYLKRYLFQL